MLLLAFHSIHDQNPFLVPAIILGSILLLRAYLVSRPGPWRPYARKVGSRSLWVLGVLFVTACLLTPVFEFYFRVLHCRVSDAYHQANVRIATKVMRILDAQGVPYWLDYATLLNELRGQQLNDWEQDVDLSTIHPEHLHNVRDMPMFDDGRPIGPALDAAARAEDPARHLGPALSVAQLTQKLRDAGFKITYEPERYLMQVWDQTLHGPHVDLWLWTLVKPGDPLTTTPSPTPFSESNPPVLWSLEEDPAYNPREWKHIFPLHNATWLGRTVPVPREKHLISEKEYGHYGGSYMVAQVFRGDCFHNFFQLRFMY